MFNGLQPPTESSSSTSLLQCLSLSSALFVSGNKFPNGVNKSNGNDKWMVGLVLFNGQPWRSVAVLLIGSSGIGNGPCILNQHAGWEEFIVRRVIDPKAQASVFNCCTSIDCHKQGNEWLWERGIDGRLWIDGVWGQGWFVVDLFLCYVTNEEN